MIPSRNVVFSEIQQLLTEYDGCDGASDRWNVDDALSDLIIRLNGETRRARRHHQPVDTEAVGNVA